MNTSKFQYDGFKSLLCSINERPLQFWSKYIAFDGSIRRIEDAALKGDKVIEIMGKNQRSNSKDCIETCISCPPESNDLLNSHLPILIFVIKNLKREGKIGFLIVDQMNFRRRINLVTNTTREKIPKISPTSAFLPFILEDEWNILEIDLRKLCMEIYGTEYQSLQRIIVYSNFCVRRIYLQDRHYDANEKPPELYQTLMNLYASKRRSRHMNRKCQTEFPIIMKKLTTLKPESKRKNKKSQSSNVKNEI